MGSVGRSVVLSVLHEELSILKGQIVAALDELASARRAVEFGDYLADAADQVAEMFAKGEERDHDTSRDVLKALASAAHEFCKRAALAKKKGAA